MPDLGRVLFAWWFAYATNSFYWVRHPSNQLNEKWLEDGIAVSLSKFFIWDPKTTWTVNIDIFNDIAVQDKTAPCDVCNGYWEVEREYEGYYKTDDCPKCDWYRSKWYDQLERVYIKSWEQYIVWTHLHKILSVFWEIEYWVLWTLFYFRSWDYEWIIKFASNDVKTVSNVKFIDL